MRSCLLSHQTYVNLDPQTSLVTICAVDHGSRLNKANHMAGQILSDAATHMVVVIYRNQLVHAFVPYSLLAMVVQSAARRTAALTIGSYSCIVSNTGLLSFVTYSLVFMYV